LQLAGLKDRLAELTAARGASGDEGEIRTLLAGKCRGMGLHVWTDSLGSLYASRLTPEEAAAPGETPRVLAAAHMDEVGFLVTGAGADGCLRYQTVGGIDPRVVPSRRLLIGKDKVPGVIQYKPIHLMEQNERETPPKHRALRIDIGAADKNAALAKCPAGSFAVFDSPLTELGEGLVVSRALDDRVGCLSLLDALAETYDHVNLVGVFTVQEESGLRGAIVAAQRLRPEIGVALEGTTANDLGDVDSRDQICNVGQGVAISFMDRASIADKGMVQAMAETAKRHGIPWQYKRGVAGGNDAAALQRGYGARPACVISVPCRYIHSANSVCSLKDVKAQGDLLKAYLKDL